MNREISKLLFLLIAGIRGWSGDCNLQQLDHGRMSYDLQQLNQPSIYSSSIMAG
jgi:hypothetical protein